MMKKTTLCFNTKCRKAEAPFKKGWLCENGDFAPLCHPCAAIFEQGGFCIAFHLDAAGWRSCESCQKPIHCGCIVSNKDYILLDAGGVGCMTCVKENIDMETNQICPSSLSLPIADVPKDVYVKKWSQIASPSGCLGHKEKPFSMWNTPAAQSGLNPRMQHDFDGVNRNPEECFTSALETRRLEYPYDTANDLRLPVMDCPNFIPSVDMDIGSHSLHRDEMSLKDFQGMAYKTDPSTQIQFQTLSPPGVSQCTATSRNAVDTFVETSKCIERLQVDPGGQSELPRYQPRIIDQELLQNAGESNSVAIPLFEKMLTASDAGRVGRLVLPKKHAEAHFPKIDRPEGILLHVLDANGKEWVFPFRFWHNNKSRIYVLEGVARCIQLMGLQAGDTVTFSRIDPGGKLVMGFRKTARVHPFGQDKRSLKIGSDVSIIEVNAVDSAGSWHTDARFKSFTRGRRKPRGHDAKRKRLGMDHEGIGKLKLTWEETQGLLCPPVDNPNVVVVENFAFEEYEEPPVFWKPTVVTADQVGSSGLSTQDVTCSQLDEIVPYEQTDSASALKKIKPAESSLHKFEGSEELSILANLPILRDDRISSSTQTAKHPHYRSRCTCIVSSQATIEKEPKHEATCACNVSPTVKRCELSLMECMLEKDTETARKKLEQLHLPDNSEPVDDLPMIVSSSPCHKVLACKDSASVFEEKKPSTSRAGQVDLNIQPKREDTPFPVSRSSSIVKLGSGNHKLYPVSCGKSSLLRDVNVLVTEEPDEVLRGGNGVSSKLDDCIQHDLCLGAKNNSADLPHNSKPAFMPADGSNRPPPPMKLLGR